MRKTVPLQPTKVMVSASDTAPADRTVLKTPEGVEDVQVVVVSRWRQVLIRTVRTYLQGFVGFLVAGQTGAADAVGVYLPAGDFLALCISSASLALAPAVISVLQNTIELLSELDSPQTRA